MSHLKEREEKNCLNCNAIVYGKYCHICGQENIHPKETALHLVSHFFQDITHFDGKFFTSLKLLITRPGFLPREYLVGRRSSYLNPVRMYVFSSAIFFLIFFSVFHVDESSLSRNGSTNGVNLSKINQMDSATFAAFTTDINIKAKNDSTPMTRQQFKEYIDKEIDSGYISFAGNSKYRTKALYDSAIKAGVVKDGWFRRKFVYRQIELNEKYKGNKNGMLATFMNALIHSTPQLLFVSLPIFALLLGLLYVRQKQFYYVNHAIFTIHFFIFQFIAVLAIFGINKLADLTRQDWLTYISVFIGFYILYYNYRAMRVFYQQGRGKTFLKLLLLHVMNLFVIIALFIFFSFFSLLNI